MKNTVYFLQNTREEAVNGSIEELVEIFTIPTKVEAIEHVLEYINEMNEFPWSLDIR